jgi:ATP-binding cassette subfamily B protein
LLKLLLALYQPGRGEMFIGDEPFRTFDARAWRARVGAVMQDGYLFSGSIAQNIACASTSPDEGRLHKVVRLASMEDFITGLPLGWATHIGDEGQGLSGGQRQRILLARALYKEPEFLFLDEATSSLDANNERVIMNHLRDFGHGRTVVVIAHRLSTVRDADQIVVLDQGRIVEQGNHESLARRRGHYYELVRNQLELEKTAHAQSTVFNPCGSRKTTPSGRARCWGSSPTRPNPAGSSGFVRIWKSCARS